MAVLLRIPKSFTHAILEALAREYGFSLDTPYQDLPEEVRHMFIYGSDREVKVHYRGQRGEGVYDVPFEGLIKNVNRRYRETHSDIVKAGVRGVHACDAPVLPCKGQRLKQESLAVTVGGKNIYEITELSDSGSAEFPRSHGADGAAVDDRPSDFKGDPGPGRIS